LQTDTQTHTQTDATETIPQKNELLNHQRYSAAHCLVVVKFDMLMHYVWIAKQPWGCWIDFVHQILQCKRTHIYYHKISCDLILFA